MLVTLSCSFPEYAISGDPETSTGGSAAGGARTESVAGTTADATAGMAMGGTASGAAAGGTASVGGTAQEPSPAGGSGGAGAAGGTAGESNQTGGTMGTAGTMGSGGTGSVVMPKACADLEDLPPECLCRDRSGHAYLFCSTSYAWSQSNARCGFYEMSLAKIESPGEDSWILKQAHDIRDPRPLTFFWIGASSVDSPGAWHWPDGTTFWRGDANGSPVSNSYFNWRTFNPLNTKGTTCVFMDNNGWEEGDCSIRRGYVCEAK